MNVVTTNNQVKPAMKAVDDNPIIFYCKDCEEVVDTNRVGGKYVYKCKRCGTKNVAFGTKKSIYGFFKLEDKKEENKAVAGAEVKVAAVAAPLATKDQKR